MFSEKSGSHSEFWDKLKPLSPHEFLVLRALSIHASENKLRAIGINPATVKETTERILHLTGYTNIESLIKDLLEADKQH